MSYVTVATGTYAISRGEPDGEDMLYIANLLSRYPRSAVAVISGRSQAFVEAVAERLHTSPPKRRDGRPLPPPRQAPPPVDPAFVWRQSLPPEPRRIIEQIAAAHGLSYTDLIGKRRFARIFLARQAAYFEIRALTGPNGLPRYSLPQIAHWFGGRDHTTVLHGVRKHKKRMEAARK